VFLLVEVTDERATAPGPVGPGARLLTHEDEAWYRALVLSAPLPSGKTDLGSSVKVGVA
jgi:hypothetical protein